jgi:hypothetical protein
LVWAKSLDRLVPWEQNGFIAWRALSGIFAAAINFGFIGG